MNTEIFIEQAKNVHGNKYDYSKSIYIKNDKKLLIICPVHGEFLQDKKSHIDKKCGCPRCSNNISLTKEQFVNRANAKHNFVYCYVNSNYISYHKKLKITCREHGEFLQSPYSHLFGSGCPKCGRIKTHIKKTISTTEFIKK